MTRATVLALSTVAAALSLAACATDQTSSGRATDGAGWRTLFDGTNTDSFRGYRQAEFPAAGWVIEGDALRHVAGAGGGDIVTRDQFGDFELAFEWRVAPKANSGVMYRCTEDHGASWETGPEMQILDNRGHGDGVKPETSAGACYALYAPASDVTRPAGEWNTARIIARADNVEHWINGERVVAYTLRSEDWNRRLAASKFSTMPDFGTRAAGHIAFQDHGDDVWFRNIRVRTLDAPAAPR